MLIHVSLPDRVLVVCHLQSLKFTFHFVSVECPSWRIKTYSNLYVIEGTEVSSLRLNSLSKWVGNDLTLKVPITTAADDIHKYFFLFFRENKT